MKKSLVSIVVVAVLLAALLAFGPAALAAYAWTDTGGPAGSAGVKATVYDQANDVLYAATTSGGVWRCRNASTAPTWGAVLGWGAASNPYCLVYDAANDILYAGTDGDGVWRRTAPNTTGPTWTDVTGTLGFAPRVPCLYYVGGVANNLFAGSDSDTVWRLHNPNGAGPYTWVDTTGPAAATGAWHNSFAYDGQRLYSCITKGLDPNPGGIWRCENPNSPAGPFNWTEMAGSVEGLTGLAARYDSVGGKLYATTRNTTNGRYQAWRCDSPAGTAPVTWTNLDYPDLFESLSANALFYDSTNNLVYTAGQNGVYRCEQPDGDATWVNTGEPLTTDGANTVMFVTATNRIFAASATDDDVYSASIPAPVISSISPTKGDVGDTVTVNGSNFGGARGTSFVSFGAVQATDYSAWGDTQVKCEVPEGVSGAVDVTLTTYFGGESNAETFTLTHPTWYLAEGSTDWGFSTYITMENPNDSAVTARVTYNTRTGVVDGGDINLPASSQTTLFPADVIGATDFSTRVECLEGMTIAVDRTMKWTGPGAASEEGHAAVGVTSPATTWYLPEGSSAWGFECWLLIQNPGATDATCTVTYMIEGEGPSPTTKTVPAGTRATFNMADDIGARDASIQVTSDVPVIPERAMYRNNRREGHDSTGTTTAANNYYLAEGSTNWGFTTYVLVQNPNATAATVTITYMTSDYGPQPQTPFAMEPGTRTTIRVNDYLPGHDLSTLVTGTQPIIAERAMYWDNGAGEACHDSIGMDTPHATFYLPDGETTNGRETWTLVQNPGASAADITVTYYPDGGGTPVTFTDTVEANSRKTYNMAESGIVGRAAVKVESTTAGRDIIVERAMYWNNRGAGTDTIGGYSD